MIERKPLTDVDALKRENTELRRILSVLCLRQGGTLKLTYQELEKGLRGTFRCERDFDKELIILTFKREGSA